MQKEFKAFTQDFGTVSAYSTSDTNFTVAGVVQYGWVTIGWPTAGLPAGIIFSAWPSAADTVTIRLVNITDSDISVGSLTFTIVTHMEE